MQVVWLDEAKVLFKEAISLGFLAFGEKAVIRFVDEVQRTNERLSVSPILFLRFQTLYPQILPDVLPVTQPYQNCGETAVLPYSCGSE